MVIESWKNDPKRDPKEFKESDRGYFERGSQGDVDRNYGQYQYFLGIDFESMRGKSILDIGGGVDADVQKVAEKFGVEIISMSPEYASKDASEDTGTKSESKAKLVVGRAQEMPFKDSTFDYELALYSVPMYLPPVLSEYEKCFREILRTLKSGGKAFIFPVKMHFGGAIDDPLVLKTLDSLSSEITYVKEYKRSQKGLNVCITITKNGLPIK
jgi:ubiquinone/menaquinone biosynthesis C-methylase UbiE